MLGLGPPTGTSSPAATATAARGSEALLSVPCDSGDLHYLLLNDCLVGCCDGVISSFGLLSLLHPDADGERRSRRNQGPARASHGCEQALPLARVGVRTSLVARASAVASDQEAESVDLNVEVAVISFIDAAHAEPDAATPTR
jgi:hypothetical protein